MGKEIEGENIQGKGKKSRERNNVHGKGEKWKENV